MVEITLDQLFHKIMKANLTFEFGKEYTDTYFIKIYDYSPTAQAGYEHRLLFNHRHRNFQTLIDTTMEWILTHIRIERERKRP